MTTARFYKYRNNEWHYAYSKVFDNLHQIKDSITSKNIKAEVFDDCGEKIREFTWNS